MATNAKKEWKDHGWWIMAEEAEKPMLWITDHAVLEGRHWLALGKEFGEILQITTSGSDFQIFHVHTAEDPLLRYKLQRRLLFASIPRICVEAKPPRKGLTPLVQLWNSIPLELRSVRETCIHKFLVLTPEEVLQAIQLHLAHNAYDDMQTEEQVQAVDDRRRNDPEDTDPIYRVVATPVNVNWMRPEGRGGRHHERPATAVEEVELVPTMGTVRRRKRNKGDRRPHSDSTQRTSSGRWPCINDKRQRRLE
jgi:hypothetical protein